MSVAHTPIKGITPQPTMNTNTDIATGSNKEENQPSTADSQPSSQGDQTFVNASHTLKIPAFYKEDPESWFMQIEMIFEIHNIKNDKRKFGYVMTNLDASLYNHVKDLWTNPPADGLKYETLKTRIIGAFQDSKLTRLRKLMQSHELGTDKPSVFLRRLRNHSGGMCDDFLKVLFMEQLPPHVRSTLSIDETIPLDSLAKMADNMMDAFDHGISSVSHSSRPFHQPTTSSSQLSQQPTSQVQEMIFNMFSALSTKVEALQSEVRQNQHRSSSRGRNRNFGNRHRSSSRSRNQYNNHASQHEWCWYHQTFGTKAKKCGRNLSPPEPCAFKMQEN